MNECKLFEDMYYDVKYIKKEYTKNLKKQKRINRFLVCCLVIAVACKVTININNCEKGPTDVK